MASRRYNKAVMAKRFKDATTKQELKETAKGALAVIPFLLIPSIGRKFAPNFFSGWTGFTFATLSTWAAGVAFDIKALRYAAPAVGAIQLTYVKGSGAMAQAGIPVWRMGADYSTDPITEITDSETAAAGVNGLSEYMQSGSQVLATASGKEWVSRLAPELENPNTEMSVSTINDYVTSTTKQLSDYTVAAPVNTPIIKTFAKQSRMADNRLSNRL
ncbi:MAG: hypothetical protein ACOVNU_12695 [Candidatus Kapaibacteriota bacterium]|jgi:hypothetical protein